MTATVQDRQPHGAPLRVMICPHELVTGGSQINAIDLATKLRDRGHIVEIYAPDGPLVSLIEERGLQFRTAPPFRGDSARPDAVRAMRRAIRSFKPDIVHVFESPPALVAGMVSLTLRFPLVVSIMSMSVSDFIPQHASVLVGTAQLCESESLRRSAVHLMEPPVDTVFDRPRDRLAARAELGVPSDHFVVSVVGRLSREHQKAAGVAEVVVSLASTTLPTSITLLVAGAGDAEDIVEDASRNVANPRLAVRLLGNVADPRTVYDAADVAFGMGGSALRALSHGKPLVVQGSGGFWKLFTPESAPEFFAEGFFGHGGNGGSDAVRQILSLIEDSDRRAELGGYGRSVALHRYSLDEATSQLECLYREETSLTRTRSEISRSAMVSLARYCRFRIAVASPRIRRAYRAVTRRR